MHLFAQHKKNYGKIKQGTKMLNFGASKPREKGGLGPRGPPWIRTWFYCLQMKLQESNVFTPVFQSFCSLGGACMVGGVHGSGACVAGAWQ